MPYTPVTVEQFRGLRLLPEQGEARGSVSMLNADLSRDFTQVGVRGGLSRLGTGTASYHRIAPLDSSTIIAFRNNGSGLVLQAVTISSGSFGTATTSYGSSSTVCSSGFAAGGFIVIMARSGSANEDARIWSSGGGLVNAQATYGGPRYVAMTPTDQRLAVAHFTTSGNTPSLANGTTSTVFFSDPGDAATYQDDNWVKLDPDDGDEITGMVAWRELLFVAKRSKLYVFYGTSIDATGSPVFNYRTVDLPARTRATTNRGGENIVAGGDAVYLLLADGVYRTTGGTPEIVSRDITPLFDGTGDSGSLFPSTGDWTIGYATNRMYLSYQNGSAYRTLVYDTILREWLLWDIHVDSSAIPTNVIEWVNSAGLPTGYVASGAKLFSFTKTATSDDGTAIVSSYRSGFDDLGHPSLEKVVRQAWVTGTGSPTVAVYTDYGSSDANAAAVTLGTAPTPDEAVHRKAYKGRLFGFGLSASSGLWTAQRLTLDVRDVRLPGMRSS